MIDLSDMQAQVAALVGLGLPLLIAVILQANWSRTVKSLVSLVVYGVAGVIVAAAAGQLTGAKAWQAALLVFITGVVSHRGLWEPTGTTDAIETKTTSAAKGGHRKPRARNVR